MWYEKMPYGETLIRTQIKTLILTLIFSEHGTHGTNEKILMFQLMSQLTL